MKKKEIEIEIGGKNYICPFGLGFIGECIDNLNMSTDELFEKMDANPFKWRLRLLYESLLYKYEDNLEFTLKEFAELIDNEEDGLLKIGKFNNAFIMSLNPKLPVKNTTNKSTTKKK